MSTKENKELVRRVIEEWNTIDGDTGRMRSLYDQYYAPDFIYHDVSGQETNREEALQNNIKGLAAFPDVNYSVEDILAEGDKVAVRFTMRATHKGTFMGAPATGKQIAVKGVEIDKIVEGKIVETWDYLDSAGMMTQIGLIIEVNP